MFATLNRADIVLPMTTTYTIAPKPKYADMIEWDCVLCGHETLSRPVFLVGPTGSVIAAGTGCAAKALYGDSDNVTRRKVRNAYDLVQHKADEAESLRLERVARYGRALADLASSNWTPDLISAQRTYHKGSKTHSFPEFIEIVATTGNIPA